jgi:hypothetical protein
MVWGGIWASVLLIMLIATASLLSPTASGERRVSGAALGSSSTQTTPTEQSKSRIPLWLFGAIALTCTAGSILVSKQLAAPERPYRRPKPAPRQVVKRQVAKAQSTKTQSAKTQGTKAQDIRRQTKNQVARGQSTPPVPSPGKQPKPYLPTEFAVPSVIPTPTGKRVDPPAKKSAQAAPSRRQPIRQKTARSKTSRTLPPPATRVPVTVVPSEENHPLDWAGNSLADMLDLRKQHSLSFWIKE